MNIKQWCKHNHEIFGRRNRIFLSSLRGRIDFLGLSIGDLQEVVRKYPDNKKFLEVALARVVSRILCIAEHFKDLPFSEAMAQKYPMSRCSYCLHIPCDCPEQRPSARLEAVPAQEQMEWNLKDWCDHFQTLYGPKNKERGIENILNRLFKEYFEFSCLEMAVFSTSLSQKEIEFEFALELADTLAWTIAVANFYNRDIEAAVAERYGAGCQTCKKSECECTQFILAPVRWPESLNLSSKL